MPSQGSRFYHALASEAPLQIVGVIYAYVAIMASHSGYKAIYLSGAGVANSSYGLPDLGMTTLDNVLEDVRRITASVDIPLLVDIDTGWGNHLMIERTVKSMIQAGAAAVHIEDQPFAKRCGHRKGKKIIATVEMVERIQAAVEARGSSSEIVIMARTDAFASEGMQGAIDRALAYIDAGADMIFPEALTSLEEYAVFKNAVKSPILANITEFGQTPLFTTKELSSVGVEMALYPLSANRAMNLAALRTLEEIRHHGTQKHLLETMQTREELYGFLNYEKYEQTLGTS